MHLAATRGKTRNEKKTASQTIFREQRVKLLSVKNAPFGNEGEGKRCTEYRVTINIQRTKSEARAGGVPGLCTRAPHVTIDIQRTKSEASP